MAIEDTEHGRRESSSASTETENKPSSATAEAVSEAGAQTREAADEIKQEVNRLAQEAREKGQSLFDSQRKAAAEDLMGISNALKQTAHHLGEQERSATAAYAGRAAAALENVAGTLREGDLQSLLKKAEDFARRYPGAFLGGSLLAGFLLSRILKSSAAGVKSSVHPGPQSSYTH